MRSDSPLQGPIVVGENFFTPSIVIRPGVTLIELSRKTKSLNIDVRVDDKDMDKKGLACYGIYECPGYQRPMLGGAWTYVNKQDATDPTVKPQALICGPDSRYKGLRTCTHPGVDAKTTWTNSNLRLKSSSVNLNHNATRPQTPNMYGLLDTPGFHIKVDTTHDEGFEDSTVDQFVVFADFQNANNMTGLCSSKQYTETIQNQCPARPIYDFVNLELSSDTFRKARSDHKAYLFDMLASDSHDGLESDAMNKKGADLILENTEDLDMTEKQAVDAFATILNQSLKRAPQQQHKDTMKGNLAKMFGFPQTNVDIFEAYSPCYDKSKMLIKMQFRFHSNEQRVKVFHNIRAAKNGEFSVVMSSDGDEDTPAEIKLTGVFMGEPSEIHGCERTSYGVFDENKAGIIAGSVVSVVLLMTVLVLFFVYWYKKTARKNRKAKAIYETEG